MSTKSTASSAPLLVALGAYGLVVMGLVALGSRMTNGHGTYPLDDTYIHLAIAKNLARHHVWGATPYEFASCSSSILWTLLLALSSLAGLPLERVPLALNVLFGGALLVLLHGTLARLGASPRARVAALLALTLLVPLPALTIAGMEHLMHAFLAAVLLDLAGRVWERDPAEGFSTEACLLALVGPVAVAARYESLFLVAAVCAIFSWRLGRTRLAVLAAGLAWVPVVVFGAYGLRNGGSFFPNSVLLKSNTPSLSAASMVYSLVSPVTALHDHPDVLLLVVCTLGLLLARGRLSDRTRFSLEAFLGATVLHLLLARLGHFYRYEGYLFALFVFVAAPALLEIHRAGAPKLDRGRVLLAAFVALPFLHRGVASLRETPLAIREIYQQPYQMGRFVAQFYPGQGVAANDIGLIAYEADPRLVDLVGLATTDVLRARRARAFDTSAIDAITRAHGTKIAIVYDAWFADLPRSWQRVARWSVPSSYVLGGDTVSFYAVDPAEAESLAAHLREFERALPAGVKVRGENFP